MTNQWLNDEEVQYLSLLFDFINDGHWNSFGYAVIEHPAAFQYVARKLPQLPDLNGMTM